MFQTTKYWLNSKESIWLTSIKTINAKVIFYKNLKKSNTKVLTSHQQDFFFSKFTLITNF